MQYIFSENRSWVRILFTCHFFKQQMFSERPTFNNDVKKTALLET